MSLRWEKVLQNKPESKSASDRILMDASDAMENIKGLIWNEVNHSPAFTYCGGLALMNSLCSPKGKTEPSQSLNNGLHYFLHKKHNPHGLKEFPVIT